MKRLLETLKGMNWWVIAFWSLAGFTYRSDNLAFRSQGLTGCVAFLYQWWKTRKKLATESIEEGRSSNINLHRIAKGRASLAFGKR